MLLKEFYWFADRREDNRPQPNTAGSTRATRYRKPTNEQLNQDIMMKNGTMTTMPFSEQEEMVDTADINPSDGGHHSQGENDTESPAISDFQAAAKEFHAAFNTALYELELSRKTATERATRIDELDESIKTINSALNDEVSKNNQIEEEFRQETEQLKQRIEEIESERNNFQQQLGDNENALNVRTEENMQLSSQLEDLTGKLEQHTVESQRIEEEFVQEKDMLTGELNELKEQVKSTQDKLSTQQQQLNERDKELADSKDQIDALTNNLNSRVMASEQLEQEYQQETATLGTEIQELKENLQTKDGLLEQRGNELESGANEIASLNERVHELNDEIQAQAASLQMQSESHISSREELESRINDISGELESMHSAQKELEAHAEKLENLNRALHESSISENDLHKTVMDDKNNIIESLRAKLAAACEPSDGPADNASLIDDLHAEIRNLESKLQQSEPDEVSSTVDDLRDETGKLKAELAVSEEKREQLQVALANAGEMDGAINADQSLATLESQPVAETADRNRFVTHLNALLADPSDSDKNHTVMYILLDNFIRVRDEIGIMNSEHVIKEISEIIASCCDDNDTVSRFGDCTFAILSRHESTEDTQEKAEMIRSSVEHHIFEISGHSMITSTSIGICRIRENDTRAEDIISRADLSCEAARSSGGNKVMVNSAVTEEMITLGSNVNHEKMISAALAEDRMMIYYQPISCLKGNNGNHFEILVRIVDESGNMILPGEFFSMAETTGQAVDIDLYVIEKVIRMMAENRDKEMTLFIKLTRQTVADHDFALWVIGKINEYNINPEKLVFEISENTLQSNLKNLSMLSKALHAIGCRIAIEHYRMSTKPQHLLHIHTDYLKIDSSLVEGISRKGESLEKVTAIMAIARENNYITIAEGVENPANLAMLWELGVSLAQGYFIQAPAGNLDFDFQDIASENSEEESNKSTFKIG